MKKEILIIDDSWTTLVLLEWFLNEHGYNTVIVTNVEEALIHLETHTPDLILLDIQMPKISGYEFLKEYGKTPKISTIPVLIISAIDDKESINTGKELGAIGFVPKPFKLEHLLEKVKEIIKE
jgi:DNA-binding response OmpR family regulator